MEIEIIIKGKILSGKSTIAAILSKFLHNKGFQYQIFDDSSAKALIKKINMFDEDKKFRQKIISSIKCIKIKTESTGLKN